MVAGGSLQALRANHLHPIMHDPPSSQDLNVIEEVWSHLRTRLFESAPEGIETRADFIRRLHGAVRSLNTNGKATLLKMSYRSRERAQELLNRRGERAGY